MKVDARDLGIRVVRAASLPAVAATLVSSLAQARSVALARVWLDESLELAGSAGTPSGGGSYSRVDGEFSQIAVTHARIREIAAAREPYVVRGIRGDEEWVIDSWAARQGVRAFLAFPMLLDDRVEGVMAVFDREIPDDRVIADLQFIADIAAARVAELRAREQTPPSLLATSVPAERDGGHQEGRRSRGGTEVVTRAELRRLEKENIEAALARTGGRIFGAGGAAQLLGMKPTTLASRIKALDIRGTARRLGSLAQGILPRGGLP